MRFLMIAAVSLVLAGLVLGALLAVQEGRRMRACEVRAAAHTEQLMRAEESFRDRGGTGRSALYGTFEELGDAGLLQGFEPVIGAEQVRRRDGYLFKLVLLPSSNPADDMVRLGQRYELWAWPEAAEDRSLVLYYGNNAGYLIQGENGSASGSGAILPTENPLQKLDELSERGVSQTLRWTVLKNVREE